MPRPVNRPKSHSREIHRRNIEFHEFHARRYLRINRKFLHLYNIPFRKRTFISSLSPRFTRLEICKRELWWIIVTGGVCEGREIRLNFSRLCRVSQSTPRNRSQFANNLHESPGNSTAEWLDRSIMKHGGGGGGGGEGGGGKGASCQFHA